MKKINKIGDTLLLVDYNNIMHKSCHVYKRFTHKGKFTGGVYGFIKQLLTSCEANKPTHIVMCKDSPPYLRKEFFPDYKGDRKKLDEEYFMKLEQSKKFINEFLDTMNIQIEEHKGHEADDIIAQICKTHSLLFNKIIVKSNDDDLFQLLNNKVVLERNKGAIYTLKDFKFDYDLKSTQWIDVIALKGSHNAVPGISGIGIKNAVKIVKNKDLFDKYYPDYKNLIDRNRKLIKLPYHKLNIKVDRAICEVDAKRLRLFLAELAINIRVEDILKVM